MSQEVEFIVSISTDDVYISDAEHLTNATIAKFIREEIRSCGGHFAPEDWQFNILRNALVRPVNRGKKRWNRIEKSY